MSKIQVDAIEQQTACGTTLTAGGGAGKTVVVDATTVTLGRCGGTVALASGASQTGFGRTGTVDWQTTPKTATFTAVSGEGYFCNTSGGAFTVNLPAGVAGAIVSIADYAGTFQTSNLTVSPNGSEKIGGLNIDVTLNTEGQSVTLVFVDSTQGWVTTADSTENVRGNPNLTATVSGACNTLVTAPCCANVKIATFTGPGSFTVTSAAVCAANNVVGYMVVAGGGGGGIVRAGAGAGGGFREGRNVPIDNFTASPLVANAPTNAVTVTAQTYPITVGAGGGAGAGSACGTPSYVAATPGSNSIFSTIISTGGGKGGSNSPPTFPSTELGGGPGGSGGGEVDTGSCQAGTGNTPPVSPAQGNNGGAAAGGPKYGAGGGGGATAVGANGTPTAGGNGGAGATTSITGSPVARAGGGGAGTYASGTPGTGGTGGGGNGGPTPDPGHNGTVNTGGGGGGADYGSIGVCTVSGTGGSGIVIIRYKFQ